MNLKICIIICFIIIRIFVYFPNEISKNTIIISNLISLLKQLINAINRNNSKENNFIFYKIVGISYSNEIYQTQLQYCKKSALEIGKVNEFYDYNPNDMDIEFKKDNIDILSRERGNGYWLWKPYFILKTLNEKLEFGDFLIYTDATILYKDNVNVLIDFLNKKNEDMWFYKQHKIEKVWAKRDAFILMGADSKYYTETFTYNAAFQIYKKTKFSLKFVQDYLYYSKDKRIITDDQNTLLLPNYMEFKENRHDQTVLSILIKKYNLASSGKTNINYKLINNIKEEMPFIFCHYRRKKFKNYVNLKRICKI